MNVTCLIGNVTRDAEVRSVGSDGKVANFGIALNRRFKSGDDVKEETTFVDIEAWDKLAEFAGQHLTKGKAIEITGRLKSDSWEDKETGTKRSKLLVRANEIRFVGPAPTGDGAEPKGKSSPAKSTPKAKSAPSDDDDEPLF